jgi:hypothetical protein
MNYINLPSTAEEIREEAEWQKEAEKRIFAAVDKALKDEFKRVGLVKDDAEWESLSKTNEDAEEKKDFKTTVKDDLKAVLLKHKLYVGSSEAAQILRELADEYDD